MHLFPARLLVPLALSLCLSARTPDKTPQRVRTCKAFVYHTDPAASLYSGRREKNDDEDDDNDDIVVLATLSACCCLYSHPSHCANGGCGSPFTFTSLSQPPHLRTPHRPHDIAKSVCGRALLQRLARGALWPVTSSFVPRYVRRQIFPCHFNLWPSPSPPKYTKRLQ